MGHYGDALGSLLIQEGKFSVNFPLCIHYFSLHADQTPNRSNVWKKRSILAHGFRGLSQSWWRRPGTVCQLTPKQPWKEKGSYRIRIYPLINFLQRLCLLIMPPSCESIEGWMHWLGQSPQDVIILGNKVTETPRSVLHLPPTCLLVQSNWQLILTITPSIALVTRVSGPSTDQSLTKWKQASANQNWILR